MKKPKKRHVHKFYIRGGMFTSCTQKLAGCSLPGCDKMWNVHEVEVLLNAHERQKKVNTTKGYVPKGRSYL
jgi:hypothetical protein